jgi:hypothetical protein
MAFDNTTTGPGKHDSLKTGKTGGYVQPEFSVSARPPDTGRQDSKPSAAGPPVHMTR